MSGVFHSYRLPDDARERIAEIGTELPWLVFLAIAVLPGLGFPVSVLLIFAGAVWPVHPGLSCLIAGGAVCLNIAWTHLVAVGPAAGFFKRLIPKRWDRWLYIRDENMTRAVWLIRLFPGIPLFVQNYLLAVMGAPLRLSLGIAIPAKALQFSGFVLTGDALIDGNFGLALGLILMIVITILFAKLLGSRIKRF